MSRVAELMWQAVVEFYRVVVEWWAGLGLGLDVRQWPVLVWLLLAALLLLLLLLLSLRRPRGHNNGLPELMVSHGEVVLLDELPYAAPASGGRRTPSLMQAPDDANYQLRMSVSNLNPFPLQLLELSVRTTGSRLPVVADAAAVVPPHGAVDVVADLADLGGDQGVFELFVYHARGRPRGLKLVAPLEWEPWNHRYRLRAMEQRMERSQLLASQQVQRHERRNLRGARLRAGARGLAGRLSAFFGGLRRRLAEQTEAHGVPNNAEAAFEMPSPARYHPVSQLAGEPQGARQLEPPGVNADPAPRRKLEFPEEF